MGMNLGGVEFSRCLGGAGVQGFFGEGYWYHRFLKPFGLDFQGLTFVSKTATLYERAGNMPLTRSHRPRSLWPSCIKLDFRRKASINAVGLSNRGLAALIAEGSWQIREEPFFVSIMSIENTKEKRLGELKAMITELSNMQAYSTARFGLQINLSCPNTGHKTSELLKEASGVLDIALPFNFPTMLKFSIASAPYDAMLEIEPHPALDAICFSNGISWGWEKIDWEKAWGSKKSPLAHLGGGGLSGDPLRPFVLSYICGLRWRGFKKHINGCGGILRPEHVDKYRDAGADSISFAAAAMLAPTQVQPIIQRANSLTWR